MFSVTMFGARIYEESKKPLNILFNMPICPMTRKTKQIHKDIYCNTVALSGMEFFFLTRPLILSIVGTVCTYEIIIMEVS